jgi:hypothetical protein
VVLVITALLAPRLVTSAQQVITAQSRLSPPPRQILQHQRAVQAVSIALSLQLSVSHALRDLTVLLCLMSQRSVRLAATVPLKQAFVSIAPPVTFVSLEP